MAKLSVLYKEFFNSEKSGGVIIILCTIISLFLANSSFGSAYHHFWLTPFAGKSLEYWINDGLMAVFFLLIGLELEREVYQGELSNYKSASLPIFAAIGGMLIPAALYLFFNYGTAMQSGAGIPMATDIAFALGVLSLLGKRVPASLKIFLTALAVMDDLGAILVIAFFYTQSISAFHLFMALGIFVLLLGLNRLRIHNLVPYLLGAVAMWYFMLHSGVHATISGILLAFAIPFGGGKPQSASYRLQHFLHKPVAFFIIPVFVLANTAIVINGSFSHLFSFNYSVGIAMGLVLGKPMGILLFSFLAVKLGASQLPDYLNWKHILGAGLLGGIGFTMSIFICLLAFNETEVINNAKLAILVSSFIAGVLGYLILRLILKKNAAD